MTLLCAHQDLFVCSAGVLVYIGAEAVKRKCNIMWLIYLKCQPHQLTAHGSCSHHADLHYIPVCNKSELAIQAID